MIPARFAPQLFGLILSGLMTFIITAIATWRVTGFSNGFVGEWMGSWITSWIFAFPIVLFVAPMTRKLVARLVMADA